MRDLNRLLQNLKNADAVARRNFRYKAEAVDTWRSQADAALSGGTWHGDCDDLASTTLDILTRTYPKDEHGDLLQVCYRLRVKSAECPPAVAFDHMIAAVKVGKDLWIVGDTFCPARKIEHSPHMLLKPGRIHSHSKLSEGIAWRAGFGDMLKA